MWICWFAFQVTSVLMKEILFIVVKIGCEFVSLSSFNSQAHWWKKEEKNKNKNKMTIQIVSYKFIHQDNYPINSTSISIFSIQAGRSNFRLEVSPLVANGILKNGLSLGSEFRHPEHAVQRLRSESRIMLGSKIQCEFVSWPFKSQVYWWKKPDL